MGQPKAIHSSTGSGDGIKKADNDSKSLRKELLKKLVEIRRENLKSSIRIVPIVVTEKESIGKRNASNLLKDAECGKPEMKSKNSIRSISKSSQKIYKSVNTDFINDASSKARKSENSPLKGDDTFSASSTMKVEKSEKASTSNLKKSEKSLTSLTSFSTSENETILQWLAKKSEDKKIQTNNKLNDEKKQIEKEKNQERDKILAREKNLEKWLESKKLEHAKKLEESQENIKTEALKERDRKEKNFKNHIKYEAWLANKQQEEKAKKILDELEKFPAECDREEKITRNQKAFEEWLKSTKNRPKPLPPNSLDGLRSSLSLKYINSAPWVPTKDEKVRSQAKINKKKFNV